MIGVLRHRHFRNVWSASFVSNVGNWMEMLGVQMIVAHATGSLAMMGYLGAAQLAPIPILGIFGGLLADRVNRRTLLIVTQIALMLVAVGIAAVVYLETRHVIETRSLVNWLLGLSVLQGIAYSFNVPAWQVLTPRLVPKSELTDAITLNGIQFNAARVVGPALAGTIMGVGGPVPLLVFNAITFMVVVLVVSTTPDAPAPARDGTDWRSQILAAWRFISRNRGPLAVFAAMVLMSFLAAPLIRMLPLYVIDVYQVTDRASADRLAGVLLSVLGVGAVLGGLSLGYLPKWYPKHHAIPVAIFGAGLTITIFGLTRTSAAGMAAMFFVGLFWIWGFNQSWAAMQHQVADSMRGRVMAIANVAAFGATAIGNLLAGWLGELTARVLSGPVRGMEPSEVGAHLSIIVLSVTLCGAGLVMMIWRVPEVDGMPRLKGASRRSRSLIEAVTASEHRPRPGERETVAPTTGLM
jgi:MFS family permease